MTQTLLKLNQYPWFRLVFDPEYFTISDLFLNSYTRSSYLPKFVFHTLSGESIVQYIGDPNTDHSNNVLLVANYSDHEKLYPWSEQWNFSPVFRSQVKFRLKSIQIPDLKSVFQVMAWIMDQTDHFLPFEYWTCMIPAEFKWPKAVPNS